MYNVLAHHNIYIQTYKYGEPMNIEDEKKKIALFIKTGLVVLSIILVIGIINCSVKKVIEVSTTQSNLPTISYCIDDCSYNYNVLT